MPHFELFLPWNSLHRSLGSFLVDLWRIWFQSCFSMSLNSSSEQSTGFPLSILSALSTHTIIFSPWSDHASILCRSVGYVKTTKSKSLSRAAVSSGCRVYLHSIHFVFLVQAHRARPVCCAMVRHKCVKEVYGMTRTFSESEERGLYARALRPLRSKN